MKAQDLWDAEYRSGRYVDDGPVPLVDKIVSTLRGRSMAGARGIYLGCGNGRNYVPLREAGLALEGLDVSPVAIESLLARAPGLREGPRITCGDIMEADAHTPYAYVVAIQSLMHGMMSDVEARFAKVDSLVAPGGLLFVRINSTASEVGQEHEVIERTSQGGRTMRYLGGERDGLVIHFFTEAELSALLPGYAALAPLTTHIVRRAPPETGQWTQMELMLQKADDPAS